MSPFKPFSIPCGNGDVFIIGHPACVTVWDDNGGVTIVDESGDSHPVKQLDLGSDVSVRRMIRGKLPNPEGEETTSCPPSSISP